MAAQGMPDKVIRTMRNQQLQARKEQMDVRRGIRDGYTSESGQRKVYMIAFAPHLVLVENIVITSQAMAKDYARKKKQMMDKIQNREPLFKLSEVGKAQENLIAMVRGAHCTAQGQTRGGAPSLESSDSDHPFLFQIIDDEINRLTALQPKSYVGGGTQDDTPRQSSNVGREAETRHARRGEEAVGDARGDQPQRARAAVADGLVTLQWCVLLYAGCLSTGFSMPVEYDPPWRPSKIL